VDDLLARERVNIRAAIVIHPARSWENRTFSTRFWDRVCARLVEFGMPIIVVGTHHDVAISGCPGMVRMTDRLTLNQIGYLVSRAACFVGPDSALIHVAGTTPTPIVAMFTAAKAEFRLPFRNGRLGHLTTSFVPSLDCYGCLHRQPVPAVYCNCERGDLLCLAQINPENVAQAVEQLVQQNRALA
jgi:ADP-heptose:LPS heptosyltransferase